VVRHNAHYPEHFIGLRGDGMNEDFIREIENHCKWIAEEMRNFRHSDECKINYAICYAEALLEMLLKKEEEIESIN
jgi:hypothetical protein